MKDNISINITTHQGEDDAEPIVLETTGRFGVINGKYYIVYKETQLTGFENTTTTVKVWDKNVTVTRRGKYNMSISYTQGEQKLCLYPTQYGDIGALVKTFGVDFSIDQEKLCGNVKVEYTLDTDNTNCEKNSLCISISPIEISDEFKSSDLNCRGFTTLN